MVTRLLRDERGGAMVEFALVVPLLLVLMMGIIDFGRAWNVKQALTDAAREGARRAVVQDGAVKTGTAEEPGTVPAIIINRLTAAGLPTEDAWDPANHTVSCAGWVLSATEVSAPTIYGCGWGGNWGSEARVVIVAPYPFSILGPVLKLAGGEIGSVQMQASSVMRNE